MSQGGGCIPATLFHVRAQETPPLAGSVPGADILFRAWAYILLHEPPGQGTSVYSLHGWDGFEEYRDRIRAQSESALRVELPVGDHP
jgi:hypothetical protein